MPHSSQDTDSTRTSNAKSDIEDTIYTAIENNDAAGVTFKSLHPGDTTARVDGEKGRLAKDDDTQLVKQNLAPVEARNATDSQESTFIRKIISDEEIVGWLNARGAEKPKWMDPYEMECQESRMDIGDVLTCKTIQGLNFGYSVLERIQLLSVENERVFKLLDVPTGILAMDNDGLNLSTTNEPSDSCGARTIWARVDFDAESKVVVISTPEPVCGCPGRIPEYQKTLHSDVSDVSDVEFGGNQRSYRISLKWMRAICKNVGTYRYSQKQNKFIRKGQ